MGAHQAPDAVLLDPLHEQVRNPECVEEVPGTLLLFSVIFSQIQKFEDVRVPRLKVDGESSWALVAALRTMSRFS
jgi:hypothetical protein